MRYFDSYLVKLDDESTKDDAQHKVTGKEPEYNATVPRRRVPVLVRLVYVGYVVPVTFANNMKMETRASPAQPKLGNAVLHAFT